MIINLSLESHVLYQHFYSNNEQSIFNQKQRVPIHSPRFLPEFFTAFVLLIGIGTEGLMGQYQYINQYLEAVKFKYQYQFLNTNSRYCRSLFNNSASWGPIVERL